MTSRDKQQFPDDGNGDALWRMQSSGDDLDQPREVDFWVVFPGEDSATGFAVSVLRKGWKVSMSSADDGEGGWQVGVHVEMAPHYESICAIEDELASLAAPHGGHNDGWGCYEA